MMKKLGGIFYAETSAENGEQIEEVFIGNITVIFNNSRADV